jgi:steroid delta-isomerase-like uncharacterized protein
MHMSEANKNVVRRWFQEVWNEGREEAVDELFTPGGVAVGLGDTDVPVRGPEEFKVFLRNMRGAIPDVRITVEDLLSEGDKVAVRLVLEGTHKGPGLGVAPTGQPVRVAGIVLVRFQDGRIVEGWNSWDQLGLLRQIGALAAPREDRFLKKATPA